MNVKREPTCWELPATKARDPGATCQPYVTAAPAWTCGTLGRRLPSAMPAMIVPVWSLKLDSSLELLRPRETEKSRCSFGLPVNSSSAPTDRAFGAFKINLEEHEPAVTVSWRSRMSMRSEEHTSELQSHSDLVCRLLLEKKKNQMSTSNFKILMC